MKQFEVTIKITGETDDISIYIGVLNKANQLSDWAWSSELDLDVDINSSIETLPTDETDDES